MLLKDIIIIPATIALVVSGMHLYKSIISNRRIENIKIEIIRHTIFSTLILVLFIVASFLEVYLSTNLLMYFSKYF